MKPSSRFVTDIALITDGAFGVALIFTGTTLTWLVLADAIALAAVALADLTAHEVTTENVVHRLEVTWAPAPGQRVAA